MPREDLQPLRHNHLLKKEFEHLGLDLAAVFHFTPLDLDLENRRLESLLDFVKRYQQYGSRESMEAVEGKFIYPPIYPGIDPWSDWYRFERWMRGESVREAIVNLFPIHKEFLSEEELDDDQIESETQRLIETIESTGNGVCLAEDIPARLIYRNLMEWINEPHELSGPYGGGWIYDGCSGYCPGCFQRPWCETGSSSCWPDDEEEGKIYYIDELKPYVSASPQLLAIISKLQAEEDASFEEWKNENETKKEAGPFLDHEGLRDHSNEDELPF